MDRIVSGAVLSSLSYLVRNFPRYGLLENTREPREIHCTGNWKKGKEPVQKKKKKGEK